MGRSRLTRLVRDACVGRVRQQRCCGDHAPTPTRELNGELRITDPVTHSDVPFAELDRNEIRETLELPPGMAARGAGYLASRSRDIVPQDKLLQNKTYISAITKLSWGHFDEAMVEFDKVSEEDPSLTHHPTLLIATAKCLMELQRYEQAVNILKKCSTLHAGARGLAETLEEAELGKQIKQKHHDEATAREKELDERRARLGFYDKSDLSGQTGVGMHTLNQLPLEEEVRDWMRDHVGSALDTVGLTYDELRGRAVVAKRFIPKGETIFKEVSTLFPPEVLSQEYQNKSLDPNKGLLEVATGQATARPVYCSHCRGTVSADRSKCSDCGSFYCSKNCQVAAAETYHMHECNFIKHDGVKVIRNRLNAGDAADMFRRYMVIVRAACVALFVNKDAAANDAPFLSHLSYMEGDHKKAHVAPVDPKQKLDSEGKRDVNIAPTMYGLMSLIFVELYLEQRYGKSWKTLPNRTELVKEVEKDYDLLFDKVKANIVEPQSALLPFLSLANHSCIPNAHITSKNELIADEDIYPGIEVTISYTPRNMPTEWKNYWLKKNKNFDCYCQYCIQRERDEKILADAKLDRQGLVYLRENEEEKKEFEDEDLTVTSKGKLTRRGLREQEERYDNLLLKYPPEFRETMLQVQEKVLTDMKEKPKDVVLKDLRAKKQRITRFEKLGLVPQKSEETIGLDVALEALQTES